MGLKDEYDVAIIASTDTDLRPAIEGCHALGIADRCEVEVAAWRLGKFRKRINIPGKHVWCHFLDREDYDACHDSKDYSKQKIPASAPPKGRRAGKTALLIPENAQKG